MFMLFLLTSVFLADLPADLQESYDIYIFLV